MLSSVCFVSAGRGRLQLDSTHRRSSLSAVVPARLASASPKADFGASCERFWEDSQACAFDSESTENHGGPSGPVHRQSRRCDSVFQHQVRSIRTVYIQTAQKTVEVVSTTEFNDPVGRLRSTKCGSLTEILEYLLYCRALLPCSGANSASKTLFWRE